MTISLQFHFGFQFHEFQNENYIYGKLSAHFAVCSGVRQGSCLSPAISNVFMNVFVVQLKRQRIGCCISSMFLGCILYADDKPLLSPTAAGLQKMLDKCSEIG